MRRIVIGAVIALLTLAVAWLGPVHAATIPSANVGDPVSKLTAGLVSENSDTVWLICGGKKIYGVLTYWYPRSIAEADRDPDTNSVLNSVQFEGMDRVLVSTDVDNGGEPIMWYSVDEKNIVRYTEAFKENQDPNMDEMCKPLTDLYQ